MENIYKIERLSFRAEGIAHDENNKQIRIANALPGETVACEDASAPRRRQAVIRRIVAPSPLRAAPPCPQYGICGACQFQCLAYDAQQDIKQNNWLRLIRRYVDIPGACRISFCAAPQTTRYRNRADTIIIDGLPAMPPRNDIAMCAQIHGRKTPAVNMLQCALHTEALERWIGEIAKNLPHYGIPDGARLTFEANAQTRSRRIILSALPETAPQTLNAAKRIAQNHQDCAVIFQELPPRGSHVYPAPQSLTPQPWYVYDMDIRQSPLHAMKGAWTPVSPTLAHMIRDTLHEWCQNQTFNDVLEIGCGCGTHTAIFAGRCQSYTGIDAAWPAIQSAQYNARYNRWQNTLFFTDTAEHYLDKRYYQGRRADAVVLHSNRMPYAPQTIALCRRFGAKKIFIVAPTAYAIARECANFASLGYRLRALRLCDTLPMTYHMMAAAYLSL